MSNLFLQIYILFVIYFSIHLYIYHFIYEFKRLFIYLYMSALIHVIIDEWVFLSSIDVLIRGLLIRN